jgi:glycosyltransferase involved in cell wall biosynthesis
MRILYVASGIPVPGTLGGSTHAYEVARGLALRGHTVHLVAAGREGWHGLAPFARLESSRLAGFHLHHQDIPKLLAFAGGGALLRLARAIRPHVIMERYYNFAGGGVWAAQRLGVPCLLEVNALMVDPPQVFKRRLDAALGNPLRRLALAQCHRCACIVTPLHTTIPAEVERSKIVELPWGADVERFASITPPRCDTHPRRVLFAGSCRAWHGVSDFVRAGVRLLTQGYRCEFVVVGDGPQRQPAQRLAAAWPGAFDFRGAVPYEQMPAELGRACVGVAPFNTAAHPALRAAGFFWSPLKIYEYMAAGLPVVTTRIDPLTSIIREGQEGVLFREGDGDDLAAAIARLLDAPAQAQRMGQRARERVVAHYSWQRHCAELERRLLALCGMHSAESSDM